MEIPVAILVLSVTLVTNVITAAITSLVKDRQTTTRLALIELRLSNIETNTSRHRDTDFNREI